tara:strand:- start:951 stop:1496 length:546 start_codon:yes stop_codon:yes gene_type:complete
MDIIENQILQLISTTWINSPKSQLSTKFVARYWSIDTQWMNYSEAEILISKLIEHKWINESDKLLSPNIKIDLESITFGWAPKKSIHHKIPQNDKNNPDLKIIKTTKEIAEDDSSEIVKLNNSQRRLVRYISANTGVLKNEIIRRCARKKRSLGQITTTVCLLLIAKEQGMEMQELVDGMD